MSDAIIVVVPERLSFSIYNICQPLDLSRDQTIRLSRSPSRLSQDGDGLSGGGSKG